MNSSERGFRIPQESEVQVRSPWLPLTPGQPILPRSNGNGVPVGRQGNQPGRANFQDLVEGPGRRFQQTMNYGGTGQNFGPIGLMGQNGSSCDVGIQRVENGGSNRNVGSFTDSFGNDSEFCYSNPLAEVFANKNAAFVASANGTPSGDMTPGNTLPTILNSYSQVDSSWTEGTFTSLLLGSEDPNPGLNQWTNAERLAQMPTRDGFPLLPFRPNYNLNSPPRSEADATSSTTNSFPFAPVTPDHAKQFENNRHSGMLNFSVDESSSQEKDKLENLLTSSEAIENNSNELLRNNVDSSAAAVSTSFRETNNFEGADAGIDLNQTPQLKPPKRRKHRPKVIIEGKPKRTPKPDTPTNPNSKENPSGKRKYVRKKTLEATTTQQTVLTNEVTVPSRRKLDFDLENDKKGESQGKAANPPAKMHRDNQTAFNLNLDSQPTELCNGINSVGAESGEIRVQNGYTEQCQQAGSTHTLESAEVRVQNGYIVRCQQSGSTRTLESAEVRVQNGYTERSEQAGSTCSLAHSMNQMPAERRPLPERCATSASSAAIKYHYLNAIARRLNMRNGNPNQKSDKNGYSHEHQHLQRELNMNVSQPQNTHTILEKTRQMAWQNYHQIVQRNATNSNEKRGLKREYPHAIKQAGFAAYSQMGSPFLHRGIYQVDHHISNSHNFGTSCSETQKRKRMENGFHATMFSTSSVRVVNDGLRQVAAQGRNNVYANNSTFNSRIPQSYFGGDKASSNQKNGVNTSSGGWRPHFMTSDHKTQQQIRASELHSNTQSMVQRRLRGSTQVHDITSLLRMTNTHLVSSTLPKQGLTSCYKQGVETSRADMSIKGFHMAPISSNLVSSCISKVPLQEHKDASYNYRQSSMKIKGQPRKQQYPDTVQEITCGLQGLNITGWSKETDRLEQNAIVPYKGDGAVVPYEGFDLIKKRKPRPKVDLDPETNRIWKLLMGKEGSEGTDAEDKDKEKWWEEERKVFRGRADSFIARMHLVQGDRRFSQWKGSVVDSVIGVFLTQNVSDHLSSSAFMSLAARFPLRPKTTDPACYQGGASILAKEPEIQMISPNGTISWYDRIARQPVYKEASVTGHNRIMEESLSSSQNSSDFFSLQGNKGVQSCTGSNSEAEDSTRRCISNVMNGPPTLLHTRTASQALHNPVTGSSCFDDRSTLREQSEDINYNWQMPGLNKFSNLKNSATLTHPSNSNLTHKQGPIDPHNHFQFHMTPDLAAQKVGCFGMSTEESISSFRSTASGVTMGNSIDCTNRRIGHTAERISETFVRQNGVPMIQAPTIGPSVFPATHLTRRESSLTSVPHIAKAHVSLNSHQQERTMAFQSESTLAKEPVRPNEAAATRHSGTGHHVPNESMYRGEALGAEKRITTGEKQKFQQKKAIEANAKDQLYFSSETTTGMSTTMSNTRKGKAEDEKGNSFDWDSLRKLVEPNGRKKERSKDAMDSLDYEALRCANVSEISNAIKERGMNNMLAERIQDFLNRLVREHGSIDLEWLRDVPPDKAKDYLLSMWGLGLKSVECVRLLTLHHLAFPVDTNVGRIAVRLGWVPLQPLPESLQLHLLELYPMLETIQKYLWPRLCKLDQRTLYELHYQMITFGKVFCTKSKPNCNACPMRGECRHFASAFASARLALPGPEEKGIVSSSIPIATDKIPAVGIRPMPLLTGGRTEPKEIGSVFGNCEPIVEEPATPEQETAELTISDIEDAFYEDPDEIPTIKLNLEEFTVNLHNYMQENMELQDGDMSKALVALNPQAASIPTPKLKNVSRLRTEHQVYELPDSHPLLNGLDKREPDDPSPYLLAIWTPGETANSIQPPERRCGSQESGTQCNEKSCFSCNSMRETNAQTVRGTLLIPCRTAMRGSFPLNGTYFQVNEMFADHESSLNPIDVPRAWIWNLPRRTVYFGTSVSTIFKGLSTEGIQYCFWRGFVCVRGFDLKTRAPRPLMARLHFPASKLAKTKNEDK